ncbi:hypothetical protein C1H46_028906 [Malus baccata]|uniref:K Homology domain-containing protein n=1 Tax=Malus baccata TaxID=106549 RepID=A0A540LGE7_MALBA|nr:hypothetical protein C1H46_028906 [Malus baccata]
MCDANPVVYAIGRESVTETDGKGKLQKSENLDSKLSAGNVAFRVLCPASKVDNVTGEGGSVISQIFQETLVKVRVEEPVPGCDERVIIVGSDRENDVGSEHRKEDSIEDANVDEKQDDAKEPREKDETQESVPIEDSKSDTEDSVTPSLQKALQLVFERIVEGETETDGGDEESNKSLTFVCRLLVLSSQVGCLLGKGGSVIKQMSSESGAQIRILPRDKLPLCASAADELVQITGNIDAARKAITSLNFLRIFTDSGLQGSEPLRGRLPLTPSSHLTWFGFSEEGQLSSYDSKGAMRVFTSQYGGSWLPLFSASKEMKSNENYWVVGLNASKLFCIVGKSPDLYPQVRTARHLLPLRCFLC